MNGKGSDRRPARVSQRTIDENWARTFGNAAEKPPASPQKSMTLQFTGTGALVLELVDHGPMELLFTDHDLVLALLEVILDHSEEPFDVLVRDPAQQEALKQLLRRASSSPLPAASATDAPPPGP